MNLSGIEMSYTWPHCIAGMAGITQEGPLTNALHVANIFTKALNILFSKPMHCLVILPAIVLSPSIAGLHQVCRWKHLQL